MKMRLHGRPCALAILPLLAAVLTVAAGLTTGADEASAWTKRCKHSDPPSCRYTPPGPPIAPKPDAPGQVQK